MKISVVGVGQTKFGQSRKDISDLMLEACEKALASANASVDQIDAFYIGNFSSSFTDQCHLPAVLASRLSVNKEITRVESACAAGGLAFKEAVLAILSGLYRTVLVVGVEKMSDKSVETATKILATAGSKEEMAHGATFPSLYALMAQRYFFEYGANERVLAKVAVKNHKNALHNPVAQFHKRITVEDVLRSRMVALPLKLLDCSPISDGAAAVVLCAEKWAWKFTDKPLRLAGIGHEVEAIELFMRKDLTSMPAVVRAAQKAYTMAGIEPRKVDVAEVHDCFTIAELIQIEDLGFCKKGEAKNMVDQGRTEMGGEIPINPSGGLKAKGHPIGASGVAQVVEIFYQLRSEAGKRQVKNARVGLCSNLGGAGSTSVVSIFVL